MKQYFGWMFALIASLTMVSAYADEVDEVATAEEVAEVDDSATEEPIAVIIDDDADIELDD
ncbi:MAG: hypothetical protein K1000chlam3_00936 [Chlamydiae bacterium]|nr:hypothetical protein [Chlamydiota bacterium]